MKNENYISAGNDIIMFYGKPTDTETLVGHKLLSYFKSLKLPRFEATRKKGYMQIGSAYSNFKLATSKTPQEAKDIIVSNLFANRYGLGIIKVVITVDDKTYSTYAISKDDMRILFE